MKKIISFLITAYQATIAVVLFNLGLKGNCRFSPTCSQYAKKSILEKGVIEGGRLALIRLSQCQPFYKGK